MAFMAVIMGLGLLSYIRLGVWVAFTLGPQVVGWYLFVCILQPGWDLSVALLPAMFEE